MQFERHSKEQVCPICHNQLQLKAGNIYYCPVCMQDYLQQLICPTCHDEVEVIQGCGAVNYLCRKDGLISKRSILYCYLAKAS